MCVWQVHPNAERPAHLRLKMYEFAGRVVGKCLYESALGGAYKQLVRARFTRSFLAQIIGLRMNYKVVHSSLISNTFSYIRHIHQKRLITVVRTLQHFLANLQRQDARCVPKCYSKTKMNKKWKWKSLVLWSVERNILLNIFGRNLQLSPERVTFITFV